jgi:LemA protein
MWSSPLFWILVAVGVFWSLGAHNRLVRLRSAAQAASAHWCGVQRRAAQLPQDWLLQLDLPRLPGLALPSPLQDTEGAAHSAWPACIEQLQGAIAPAGAAVNGADAQHADWAGHSRIQEAMSVLQDAWTNALSESEAQGLDTQPWRAQQAELAALAALAQAQWQEAAQAYQCAIHQFPASILARAAGFRPL